MVDDYNKEERKKREDETRNGSCNMDGTVLVGEDNKEARKRCMQESCRGRSFHDTVMEHPLSHDEGCSQTLDNSILVVSSGMVVMSHCTQASSLINFN